MSSDEEDLELNEAPTPQLYATQEEDGAEENETEGLKKGQRCTRVKGKLTRSHRWDLRTEFP